MSDEETTLTQAPRPLDIWQAMRYPFTAGHRKSALLFPGLIYLVYMLFTMGGQFLFSFAMGVGLRNPDAYTNPAYLALNFLCSYVGVMIFLSPLFGFVWELAGVLRKDGYDAPPPPWDADFPRLWFNGFKFMIFSQIISAPITIPYVLLYLMAASDKNQLLMMVLSLLMMIVLVPIGPFMYGSLIQAGDDKRLARLFDFPKIMDVTLPCYWKAIGATLIYFLLMLLMTPVLILSCCTCIGYPFVLGYFIVTFFHLVIQSFDSCRPEQPVPITNT